MSDVGSGLHNVSMGLVVLVIFWDVFSFLGNVLLMVFCFLSMLHTQAQYLSQSSFISNQYCYTSDVLKAVGICRRRICTV